MTWAIDEKGYSQRRACGLVGIDPRVYRYRSSRPDDAALRSRLRKLAAERRRFGYRRLHLLLRREGVEINWKKLYRLYKEERLTVRKRGGRKRALGTRAPMTVPQDRNQRWSLDFVSDTLVDGRRFRILCVIDDFSRECLVEPGAGPGEQAVRVCAPTFQRDQRAVGGGRQLDLRRTGCPGTGCNRGTPGLPLHGGLR